MKQISANKEAKFYPAIWHCKTVTSQYWHKAVPTAAHHHL